MGGFVSGGRSGRVWPTSDSPGYLNSISPHGSSVRDSNASASSQLPDLLPSDSSYSLDASTPTSRLYTRRQDIRNHSGTLSQRESDDALRDLVQDTALPSSSPIEEIRAIMPPPRLLPFAKMGLRDGEAKGTANGRRSTGEMQQIGRKDSINQYKPVKLPQFARTVVISEGEEIEVRMNSQHRQTAIRSHLASPTSISDGLNVSLTLNSCQEVDEHRLETMRRGINTTKDYSTPCSLDLQEKEETIQFNRESPVVDHSRPLNSIETTKLAGRHEERLGFNSNEIHAVHGSAHEKYVNQSIQTEGINEDTFHDTSRNPEVKQPNVESNPYSFLDIHALLRDYGRIIDKFVEQYDPRISECGCEEQLSNGMEAMLQQLLWQNMEKLGVEVIKVLISDPIHIGRYLAH
jgi:hypothetical protein